MKISYKSVAGGSYVQLLNTGDGSGILQDFQPGFVTQVQREQLAQNASMFHSPRGNIECTLQLNWNIQYLSLSSALQAIRDTASGLLNNKVHLQVQEGSEIQYYPNAACSDLRPKLAGVAVDFSATFISDGVTPTAP